MKRVLLIPDCHIPYHDKKAWALLLKAARAFKPDIIVTLGDFVDFYAVSSHSKNPDRVRDLKWEVDEALTCLDELDSLGAHEKIYISGNHEDRLERFLQDKAPELFSIVKIPKILELDERGWRYVPYKDDIKLGKLYMTHDTGKAGKYAHYQALDAYQGNVVIGHCLPVDYEVLTRRGFVRLDETQDDDVVLAYKDGKIVESPVVERVFYDYTGEMAVFDNSVIAQRMTDRHHIYTQDGRYVPVRDAVRSLRKTDLVRYAAPLDLPGNDVSADWLRLVVAYAADGARASPGSLRWNLKKQRKIDRLTALVQKVGGTISWSDLTANGSRKSKGLDPDFQHRLLALCPDKRLPEWFLTLSRSQRQVVVDELEHWDGSVLRHDGNGDRGVRQYASSKPDEIALVQMLLTQHGIRSRLYKRPSGCNIISYDLLESEKTTDGRRMLSKFVQWKPVVNEKVGCITTLFDNFWIRTSDGGIELTGNTHRLGYAVVGNARGEPHVGCMLGWLGDFSTVDYMHRINARRDWSHGFGVAYLEPSGVIHIQPVPIINNSVVLDGKKISL